jgi:hypothetical protein
MSKTKNQILLMDLLGNPVAILAHNKENKFQHVITNGIWAGK